MWVAFCGSYFAGRILWVAFCGSHCGFLCVRWLSAYGSCDLRLTAARYRPMIFLRSDADTCRDRRPDCPNQTNAIPPDAHIRRLTHEPYLYQIPSSARHTPFCEPTDALTARSFAHSRRHVCGGQSRTPVPTSLWVAFCGSHCRFHFSGRIAGFGLVCVL